MKAFPVSISSRIRFLCNGVERQYENLSIILHDEVLGSVFSIVNARYSNMHKQHALRDCLTSPHFVEIKDL